MMLPRYQALIFDMDGTLTRPTLDFRAIRRELGMESAVDLAKQIAALPADQQREAWGVVEAHERRAMECQDLQPGSRELVEECRRRSVKTGVVTRNTRESVDHLCRRFVLRFDAVVTREFAFLKPDPAPVSHMLTAWGIAPAAALVVGDYIHDIECGRAAGTATCFFRNPGMTDFGQMADFAVDSMVELRGILFRKGCGAGLLA
jgi:HAD superfamily hydrolase (TIGR01549 family)